MGTNFRHFAVSFLATFLVLGFAFATPRITNGQSASPTPTASAAPTSSPVADITICHANQGVNGWVSTLADPSSLDGVGPANDHNMDNHQGGQDIIPPGTWDSDGRNWDTNGQAIYDNGCVAPLQTPLPSSTPSPTPTATPQGCGEDCNGTSTPSPTPSPTGSVLGETDVCANIDGNQTSVPGNLHLDASGRNCVDYQYGGPGGGGNSGGSVLGASSSDPGQILGVSTTAKAGMAEDIIGSVLVALGLTTTVTSAYAYRRVFAQA